MYFTNICDFTTDPVPRSLVTHRSVYRETEEPAKPGTTIRTGELMSMYFELSTVKHFFSIREDFIFA